MDGIHAGFILGGFLFGVPFGLTELLIGGGRYGRRRWGLIALLLSWTIYSFWSLS